MPAFPILLLWLCSVIAVAAPTADSIYPAVHQHDKRAAECYPPTRFETLDTVDINPIDCGLAILDMPTTIKLGHGDMFAPVGGFGNTVHNGSPFKLPRHFARGSCMIGVTMAPSGLGKTDSASWNEIAVKATGIVTKCTVLPKPVRRGGHDTAGEHGQIIIDIFKNADYLDFLVPINDFLSPSSLLRAHV